MKYEISEKLKKAVDYIEKLIEDGNDFYVIEAEGNIFGICCLNDAEPTVADFNSAGITDKRDIAFFYAYLIATKTCDIMMRITKKSCLILMLNLLYRIKLDLESLKKNVTLRRM